MKVLVIYATVEGQTRKIANFVSDEIEKLGHKAELVDAEEPSQISFDGVGAVVVAGSVHQRRHSRNFEALLTAHASDLAKLKTLLLSVSLSAAFPEGLEEAGDYVIEMKMRTGFTPDEEMFVGGAIRTGEYDYFAMQVVRFVVLRDRPYDPDKGEHEFTDWKALKAKLGEFVS